MTMQEFKKKLSSPIIWGNILCMFLVAIALLVGAWLWMADYTHHGEKIIVPQVTGMSESDAQYAIEHCGLITVVSDSGYNRSLPAGTILDQQPQGGLAVKRGRSIYLTINTGASPTLTMPDIADNCSVREAQARLRSLGFKLGPIEYVPGDKDWVISVKCRGRVVMTGERIPVEAPIVLVVGNTSTDDDLEPDSTDMDSDEEAFIF